MKPLAFLLSSLLALSAMTAAAGAAETGDEEVATHSRNLILGQPPAMRLAVDSLTARGKRDVVPALVLAMRYRRVGQEDLQAAFETLTGAKVNDWGEAMLWQEAHPEVKPHESFQALKLEVFSLIDEEFLRFLGGDRSAPENMDVRLEEITWGGVTVDGIPSLDFPKMIAAETADYLLDDDLVFGIEINGDARAYPLRIMGWHEMFNDVIGGVPVALAYCTLCGSGILFETQVEGRDKALVFGSSGFLYRSNKLMFDRETDSLWNQFTGQPVTGPLRGSGIALQVLPVAITSWQRWRVRNPETTVLSLDTGHRRDYGSGVVYRDYFASPDLMFPAIVRDESQLRRKDYVFGIREAGAAKAWPIEAFAGGAVINDAVGAKKVVLIGDAETRTVRAYYRGDLAFEGLDAAGKVKAATGEAWTADEAFLTGPDGTHLPRAPGHIAYWFAWDGYLGARSELYQLPEQADQG